MVSDLRRHTENYYFITVLRKNSFLMFYLVQVHEMRMIMEISKIMAKKLELNIRKF